MRVVIKYALTIVLALTLNKLSAQLLPEILTRKDAALKGNVKKVTEKSYESDAQGRKNGKPVSVQTDFYNERGFLTKRITEIPEESGKIAVSTTVLSYDQNDRCIKMESVEQPDYTVEFYYRIENGKTYRMIKNEEDFYAFTYNRDGELLKLEYYPKPNTLPDESREFTWKNGVITSIRHWMSYVKTTVKLDATYDANQQLVETRETDLKTNEVDINKFKYSNLDAEKNWQTKMVSTKYVENNYFLYSIVERTIEYHSGTASIVPAKKEQIKNYAERVTELIEIKIGTVYPPKVETYKGHSAQKVTQYITIDPETLSIKVEKYRMPVNCKEGVSSLNTHEIATFNLKNVDQVVKIIYSNAKDEKMYAVSFRMIDMEKDAQRRFRVLGVDAQKNCTWSMSTWSNSLTVNNYMTFNKNDVFVFEFPSKDDAEKVSSILHDLVTLIKN